MEVPIRIERGDGSGLTITWADGRLDRIPAAELRAACPCAACQGAASAPEGTTVAEVHAVGGYAVTPIFAPEGHSTGIYTFDLLRALGGG